MTPRPAPRGKTPALGSITRDGLRFLQLQVTASVCSPSRAGLLTGRKQNRLAHEDWLVIGKWHLGEQQQFHPRQRGFDELFRLRGGSRSDFEARIPAGCTARVEGSSPHRGAEAVRAT